MAGRRICYLAALVGCIAFYGAYQLWFSWLLLIAVLALPWLSVLLSLPAMLTLRVSPHAPGRLYPDSAENVTLRGSCRLPLPPMKGSCA